MYAKITNETTKECSVGVGTDIEYYKAIGMTEMDVEQAYDGGWYVKGYAPEKPAPTHDEIKEMRAVAYQQEVDPITAHIQRLRDCDPVPQDEIAELIAERDAKVTEIQERLPYPEQPKE